MLRTRLRAPIRPRIRLHPWRVARATFSRTVSRATIAADLTEPARWKFGTADPQVFSTIKNGAGDNMPPFKGDLKDDQIWDIVNFIRSIGPEGNRPQSK